MSVHNLRDLRYTFEGRLAPYTKPFGDLISQKILNTDSRNLLPQFNELLLTKYRNLLYLAHPTLEHFVPLVVVGGVASNSNDKASEIFNEYTGSLAWAIYEFK